MKYLNTKPGSIEEVVANLSKHQNESGYQDMFKKELEKAGKGIGAMTPAEKKAFFNKIDDKYKAKNEDIKEAVDNPYAVGMAVAKKMKNDEPPLKKSTITKAHDIAKSIKKDEGFASDAQRKAAFASGYKAKDKKEELNKDDEKAVNKVKDMLKGASAKHASQAKMLDKALKSEEKECPPGMYYCKMSKTCKPLSMKKEETIEEAKYPHMMYSKDGKEVEAKTPEDHEKYAKMGYTHDKPKSETHSFMTKKMNQKQKDAKGEKMMSFKEAYKKVKEAMNTVGDATADRANQIVGQDDKKNDPDIKKPKAKADTGSKATPIDTSPEVEYKN
jgi:hypothetical protein